MQRLLQQDGVAHIFNDEATMTRVAQAIIENGEFTGTIRAHERYGLYFSRPVGYRISANGSQITLYYCEIKVNGDKYKVITRTRPSQ